MNPEEIDLKYDIKILDLFKDNSPIETSNGTYKMECPFCGLQGGRTEGFILFPESNSAYCHSSGKWFKLLEAYALKKKIIQCLDGREKGETDKKVLAGEIWSYTLEEFKNEYGKEIYEKLSEQLSIKKTIELPGNNRLTSYFCDELGDIYKSRNILFFRGESREIIEIGRYKKINNEGKKYTETGFINVDGNRFVTLAELWIRPWTKIYSKSGKTFNVEKSMTQSIANICLASPNFQNKLPVISRLFDIQIPILYEGKLTFPKKGYDCRFGSWLPQNAPEIDTEMFKNSLDEAKNIIDAIFEEFCFKSENDKTNAIAAFITPFLRGLFPTFSTRTPVFIYMANRERAGKDYCAGCSGILYEGVNTEEPAISNDEKGSSNSNEEIRKKIMACMIQGKKRFHSANNKGLLNNSIFEGVTTAENWSDRVLGKSSIVTFANEMDYSLSGNIGIRLTPDLANRGRIINLHLIDEDANARVFKNPKLHEWIFKNRSIITSALYKLVENWVEKGMPSGTLPFTSFPEWSRICGGIMETAGFGNPCKKDESPLISLDNETEEMKAIFEACFERSPDKWLEKKDIQLIIEVDGLMPGIDFSNRSDMIKFGLKIDKYVNRTLSGIFMKVDSLESRSFRRKYRFEKRESISSNTYNSSFNTLKEIETKSSFNKNDEKVFEKTEKNDEKGEKSGNDGKVGKVSPILPYSLNSVIADNVNLTNLTNLTKPQENIKPYEKKTLNELLDKVNLYKKKKEVKKKERVKSDRELQFYEAPESMNIQNQCTKEQTLEWIKNNPKIHHTLMYKALGIGSYIYIEELINEGKVKIADDGWMVENV